MKKTVCALLLAALVCTLFSCAPDFVKLEADDVESILLTQAEDAEVDKAAFVKAYNGAEVLGAAKEGYDSDKDVILFVCEDEKLVTLFYLDDNKFAVKNSGEKRALSIKSEELAELYIEAVDPKAEFVAMDGEGEAILSFTKNGDAEADLSKIIAAYNKAEFLGNHDAKAENSTDVMLITFAEPKAVFSLSYLGDATFMVEGTEVKTAYDVKSEELEELYTKAVYPDAEFVAIDESKAESLIFTLDSEAVGDAGEFAKAYNEAEFVGNLGDEKLTTDVVLIMYADKGGNFELTYIKDDLFAVSGSFVERDYIVKSASLLKLYNDAMGK